MNGGRTRKHLARREPNGRVQRDQKTPETGRAFVYVMCLPDNGGCKIGYSADPRRRVSDIQCCNHLTVRLFWVLELGTEMARCVEQEVHQQLRRTLNHLKGEWYALTPMTAVEVVRNVARNLTAQAKSS